jgi:hypothetical protein
MYIAKPNHQFKNLIWKTKPSREPRDIEVGHNSCGVEYNPSERGGRLNNLNS